MSFHTSLAIFAALAVLLPSSSQAESHKLRVLPLGDSITWGFKSSDGNGYRKVLATSLTSAAYSSYYIGSQASGNMANNLNEGHSGALISQIADYIVPTLKQRPNVILILAGTNDMNNNVESSTAPARLGNLIDKAVKACPDAVVLVSTLPPTTGSASQSRMSTFNNELPSVVASRAAANYKVMVCDTGSALSTADLADGLHPNDNGYAKMGKGWFACIEAAQLKGWITDPVVGVAGTRSCSTDPLWVPQGQVASGPGFTSDDGNFQGNWVSLGQVASGAGKEGKGVHMGDVNGDGRDDWLYVDKDGAVTAYYNLAGSGTGGISWEGHGVIASGIGKNGTGVVFADINGDGRDDYLWVHPKTGAITAYYNLLGTGQGGITWEDQGEIASGIGLGSGVRFGDINGDGRADYLFVNDAGAVSLWLNTASSAAGGVTWVSIGRIFDGFGQDGTGVYFADIDGDGRDDYCWLDANGALTVYLNTRDASNPSKPIFITQGQLASGVGTSRDMIHLADMNGDGKADYVTAKLSSGALSVWENRGTISKIGTVGDGVVLADLNGDGRAEYIWLDTKGAALVYLNLGGSGAKVGWMPQGTVASGVGARRDQIRFADLNGDGRAEYLWVKDDGSVEAWYNMGGLDDGENAAKVGWMPNGQIASGIGKDGAGVRFADLNGDGREDYLWVDTNGAITAYLNLGAPAGTAKVSWLPQGVIATGVGVERKNIILADINGDGRADYLAVSHNGGAVQAWINGGGPDNGPNAGKVAWYPHGTIATGVGADGTGTRFADLNGDGRAEYLDLKAVSGAISVWLNDCRVSDVPSAPLGTVIAPQPTATSGPVVSPEPITVPTPDDCKEGMKFECIQCNDVDDETEAVTERWADAFGLDAWTWVSSWWIVLYNDGRNDLEALLGPELKTFSQAVAWRLGYAPAVDFACNQQNGGPCMHSVKCLETLSPGGSFILNSFSHINIFYNNIYSEIVDARDDIAIVAQSFRQVFCPPVSKDKALSIALDVFGIIFAVTAAGVWNSVLREQLKNKDTYKDSINAAASYSITIAKDATSAEDPLKTLADVQELIKLIADTLAETFDKYVSNLFGGTEDGVNQMAEQIDDGKWVSPALINPTPYDIKKILQSVIYGQLIPKAWDLNTAIWPVILIQNKKESTDNPWDDIAGAEGSSWAISDEDAESSRIYYGDTTLWLLDAHDCENHVREDPRNTWMACIEKALRPLPGITTLNGEAWGGITIDDIVVSSFQNYQLHNNENGHVAPPNELALDGLGNKGEIPFENGIRTPGFFSIPVCSAQTFYDNWMRTSNNPGFARKRQEDRCATYPCCPE